jgi:hypothetical protein
MKRSILWAAGIACLATLLATAGQGLALGLGIYGTAGAGGATWHDNAFGNPNLDHDTTHAGGGFLIDTALPGNPFSYRLSLGYEQITHDASPGEGDLIMRGVVIDQDFVMDLLTGSPLRVWVGPELRLAAFRGRFGGGGDENFTSLGIGPVMGVDYPITPDLALSWKLGYLFSGYAGSHRSSFAGDGGDSIYEGHAFVSLAVLFRSYGYRARSSAPPPPAPYPRGYTPRY